MEYFNSSSSLRDFVKSPKNTLENAKKIILQIIDTLKYIHSMKISHGDLNVENILIDQNTLQIKIIDFGIARTIDPTFEPITPDGNMYYRIPFDLECFPNPFLQDHWGLVLIILSLLKKKNVTTKQMVKLFERNEKGEGPKKELVGTIIREVKHILKEDNQCFLLGNLKKFFY